MRVCGAAGKDTDSLVGIGLIARAVMPGAQHLGFIMTTLLGIAGSIAGGFIGRLFSRPEPGSAISSGRLHYIDYRRNPSAPYLGKTDGLTRHSSDVPNEKKTERVIFVEIACARRFLIL